MAGLDVELVLHSDAVLGEGPVWDDRTGRLWWVDIVRGVAHRFDPATGRDDQFVVGHAVSAVFLTESEDPLLAVSDGIASLDTYTGDVERVVPIEPNDPLMRLNDAKVGPDGALWVGTMAVDERPGAGSLMRVDPDRSTTTLLANLTVPNGLDWPDDGGFVFVDSPTRRIDRFDVGPDGALLGRGLMADLASVDGVPDGMTLDVEGHLWVGMWNGWCLVRVSPEGQIVTRVRVPVARVTSCTFGGPGLDELYITTAARDLSPTEKTAQPDAGSVFRYRPGVAGLPARRFPGWAR